MALFVTLLACMTLLFAGTAGSVLAGPVLGGLELALSGVLFAALSPPDHAARGPDPLGTAASLVPVRQLMTGKAIAGPDRLKSQPGLGRDEVFLHSNRARQARPFRTLPRPRPTLNQPLQK